jgi:DHA1 family multidrug resistance protein-like MFS transporter
VKADTKEAVGASSFGQVAPLLGCVFIAMIGFGIALTVLPLYTERIHGLAGSSTSLVAFHLGVLTSVYALAQLVVGPAVGRLGDRIGRRPLLLCGLAGLGVTQVAFAFTSSLWWLYGLRIAGGLAASLLTVGATAAIADSTTESSRAKGMAWFGTAASLGVIAGPVLGSVIGQVGSSTARGVRFDGYTLPFVVAGLLALAAFSAAFFLVPESLNGPRSDAAPRVGMWRSMVGSPLLGLVAGSQFGLALFEGTFVLYARARFGLGSTQIAAAFVVCGAVMGILQAAVVGPLGRVVGQRSQAAGGFALMGVGLGGLVVVRSFDLVLSAVAILALGAAFVVPNLAAMVASESGGRFGEALGLKSSATSFGQFLGPLVGGAMLGWVQSSQYVLAAVVLVVFGVLLARFGPRTSADEKKCVGPDRYAVKKVRTESSTPGWNDR